MKKMMRKILLIISMALSLCLLSFSFVMADSTMAARIGGTEYATLQEAVEAAVDGDTITLLQNLDYYKEGADSGVGSTSAAAISIANKSITIDGADFRIDRTTDYMGRFFTVQSSGGLTIKNLTLDGGAKWSDETVSAAVAGSRTDSAPVAENGPLIFSTGNLTIKDSVIQNCNSYSGDRYAGPAVGTEGGTFTMDSSVVRNCTSANKGGGNNSGGIGGWATDITLIDSVIEGCANLGTDGNLAAAIFTRDDTGQYTTTLSGSTVIRENYNAYESIVILRGGNLVMEDDATVTSNSCNIDYGTVLIYTSAIMHMYDNAAVCNNSGGGIEVSGNRNFVSPSTLYMHDNASIYENEGNYAGICITSGGLYMLDDSSIHDNNSLVVGGGIRLRGYDSTINYINLLGGSIYGNTVPGDDPTLGPAIWADTAGMYLNAADFSIDGVIHLTLPTSQEMGTIKLIGAPTDNHYMLSTGEYDRDPGRDVVVPASLTYDGTTYSVEDASPYGSNFDHVTMIVDKGEYYWAKQGDTSHDKNLVLIRPEIKITKTVEGTDKEDTFSFKLKLDDTTVNGSLGSLTFKNGEAKFRLKGGENVFTYGLDADLGFTVTETQNTDYTTSVSGKSGYRYKGATGVEPVQVSFVNTYIPHYTVTFDSNGGSKVDSATVKDGDKVKKPADPKRNGYTFKGWYLGKKLYDFSTPVTRDITLIAKWETVPKPDDPDQPDDPVAPDEPTAPTEQDSGEDNSKDNSSGSKDNNGGSKGRSGSSHSSAASGPGGGILSVFDSEQPEPETVQDIPDEVPEVISEQEEPVSEMPEENKWALINLIAAILTAIGAALSLRYRLDEDDPVPQRKRSLNLFKAGGAAAAVVSIIAFFLTEDLSQPMALADRWTILMAVLLAAQAGTAYAASRTAEESDEPEDME